MYQALYRKWRPRTFDDVVGQSHITETLKRQVKEGRLSHAYLFTGTRGTGKTTCAKILARAVNCQHSVDGNPCNECPACLGIESGAVMDVLELDAASNNGVDQVRALREEAVYSPASVGKRVYIIDEVHMLSTPAFNALLKILEEPPEHLLFVLATTELHKVPATIKSRCQQFAFKRISPLDIAQRLKYVAGEENIPLTPEGAFLLSRLADGGLRDALSLLDQCAAGTAGGTLGEQEILDCLGLAGNLETGALLGEVARRDTGAVLERLERLYGAGKDVGGLLGELSALTRDLLIRRTAPQGGAGLLTGGFDETTLRELAEVLTLPRLAHILGQLQKVSAELGRSANRRADVELCLIRLCDETLDDSPAGLLARLERLEAQIREGGAPAQSVQLPVQKPEKQTESGPAVLRDPDSGKGAEIPETEGGKEAQPAAEEVTQQLPSAPASTPQKEAAVPAGKSALAGNFWPEMVAALKGKIPMGEYSFLSNPAMVQGGVEGPLLTVWVQNEFVKNMLSKPGIIASVERQARQLPGGPYRVVVTVGSPLPAAVAGQEEKHDRLDDLLRMGEQFGNIIMEE